MKFLTSLFLAIAIGIVGFLCIPLFLEQCEHMETVKVYYFEPQESQSINYMKIECKDCHDTQHTYLFYDTPKDLSYLDVMNNGEAFVEGEYYTITAVVNQSPYTNKQKVGCMIEKENVSVYFGVTFKEEYSEKLGSLEKGDSITFRGKAAPEGRLFWTDCELITE